MNIKSGLKTMAVAIPLAVSPMKSTAQTAVKEVSHKASAAVVDARLGLGFGRSALFSHINYEPKIAGSISARGNSYVVGADALVGKTNQEIKAFAGIPLVSGKSGHIDAGAVARYQHNTSGATKGVILESDVISAAQGSVESVSLNRSKGFAGAYIAPTLHVGDVNITPHVEAGVGFFADLGTRARVQKSMILDVIKDERMVNRSNVAVSSNIGVSVDADLQDGIRAGLDVNHSTFDSSTSVFAKLTYNIDRLFKHKK